LLPFFFFVPDYLSTLIECSPTLPAVSKAFTEIVCALRDALRAFHRQVNELLNFTILRTPSKRCSILLMTSSSEAEAIMVTPSEKEARSWGVVMATKGPIVSGSSADPMAAARLW